MINALRYTEDLEQAGFTPEQAKSSVKIWMDLMNDNFATKFDLKEQGLITKAEFAAVRSEMRGGFSEIRSDIKELNSKLTIKLGGIMALGITIMSVVIKL